MEQQHYPKEQRQANETEGEQLSDTGRTTIDWIVPRIDELKKRFGINSPNLVAKALGISETLAAEHLKEKE
ncbi:MAG: hypothetical protein ABIJ50_11665 [Pseudomonadota bacterium]